MTLGKYLGEREKSEKGEENREGSDSGGHLWSETAVNRGSQSRSFIHSSWFQLQCYG